MQSEYEKLTEVYKDAEWVVLKGELGTYVRIAEVAGLSLVAKWVRNDRLEGGHIGFLGESIKVLGLDARSYNALRAAGIKTVGQLNEQSEYSLKRVPNLGKRSLENIKAVMIKHNLELHP